MDISALATPTDIAKLNYIKNAFKEVLYMIQTMDFPPESKRDAIPIIRAATKACIYDGEYDGVVRKYYAFRGDHKRVWFTLDLFTAMPDDMKTRQSQREMHLIVQYLVRGLLREVRLGLQEELGI